MSAAGHSVTALSSESRQGLLRRYIRDGHKQVFGWFYPGAMLLMANLDAHQKSQGIAGDFCEIGVCQGKSLIQLCLMVRDGERTFGFDSFARLDRPNDEAKLHANLATHVRDLSRVTVTKADSRDLTVDQLKELSPAGFRMFSVDGGHDEDIVYNDLLLASGTLAIGGILLLDDYFDRKFPGVSVAANRFFLQFAPAAIAPFAIAGNKVFFSTKPHHAEYLRFLKEKSDPAIVERTDFMFSEEVIIYKI